MYEKVIVFAIACAACLTALVGCELVPAQTGNGDRSLTETEWNAIFNADNYKNMTVSVSVPTEGEETPTTIKYYIDDRKEKIASVRGGTETVTEYYANGKRYVIGNESEAWIESEYQGNSFFNTIVGILNGAKVGYSSYTYDGETEKYSLETSTPSGFTMKFTFKVANGKVVELAQDVEVDGSTTSNTYVFSGFGSTTVTLPAEITAGE